METISVSVTGDEQERTRAETVGAFCFSKPQLGLDPMQKGVLLMWRQEGGLVAQSCAPHM